MDFFFFFFLSLVPRKSSILKESQLEVRKGENPNEDLFISHNFIFQPPVHSEKYTTFKKRNNIMYASFIFLFILKSSYKLPFSIKLIHVDCKPASSPIIHHKVTSTNQPHLEAYAGPSRMSIRRTFDHSKWALVGDSGGLPGLENTVKRWGRLGQFVFLFTSKEAQCEPVKNVQASQ